MNEIYKETEEMELSGYSLSHALWMLQNAADTCVAVVFQSSSRLREFCDVLHSALPEFSFCTWPGEICSFAHDDNVLFAKLSSQSQSGDLSDSEKGYYDLILYDNQCASEETSNALDNFFAELIIA